MITAAFCSFRLTLEDGDAGISIDCCRVTAAKASSDEVESVGPDIFTRVAWEQKSIHPSVRHRRRDNWGIFRVHRFDKVKQFVLCAPETLLRCKC